MTSHASATPGRRAAARTGGPDDDRSAVVEHIVGWTLVVVIAMLVTRLGLI
ncbi:SCO1431 family membrane protein [Streptomyces sp. CAU 1734]|uniref:SCO1431 family membrane protein n=1 Tax=Streptomyces sp. CAU 1734 TaxID=3140360 RepID=UPI003260B9D3